MAENRKPQKTRHQGVAYVIGGNSYRAFGPPGGGFCATRPGLYKVVKPYLMEDLLKNRKFYGRASLLLLVATYVVGRVGVMILAQGGTDHISATLYVSIRAAVSFALLLSVVMWIVTWVKIHKLKRAGA